MWEMELSSVILPTISTMLFVAFTFNVFRYLIGDRHIHIRDSTKKHSWKSIRGTSKVSHRLFILDHTLLKVQKKCDMYEK